MCQRWNISESRLPHGSVILFREPSQWELHKWTILGATALFLFEAALIAVLILQLRRRRQAEAVARESERAAHELRRVLRPGGVLLAVTNSARHNQELFALYEMAFAGVAGDGAMPDERWDRRFEVENGAALLQTAFGQVERRDITGALVIPEAAPVLRYLDSTRATRAPVLPDQVTWEDLMAEAARIVDRTIAEQGAFRVTTHAGVFVCR